MVYICSFTTRRNLGTRFQLGSDLLSSVLAKSYRVTSFCLVLATCFQLYRMFFSTKHKEVHCFLEKLIRKQQFCFRSSFLGTFFWVPRTFQCDHFRCGCNSNIFPVWLQGSTNMIFFINQKHCLNVSVKCMENCVPLSSHFSEKMFQVYFFELRIKCHLIVKLFLTSM